MAPVPATHIAALTVLAHAVCLYDLSCALLLCPLQQQQLGWLGCRLAPHSSSQEQEQVAAAGQRVCWHQGRASQTTSLIRSSKSVCPSLYLCCYSCSTAPALVLLVGSSSSGVARACSSDMRTDLS